MITNIVYTFKFVRFVTHTLNLTLSIFLLNFSEGMFLSLDEDSNRSLSEKQL